MVSVLSVYLVIGMFQDLTIAWMANQMIFFLAGVSRSLRDYLPVVAIKTPNAGSMASVAGHDSTRWALFAAR